MEQGLFVTNGTTLKIPKGANKIRVQATPSGKRVSIVWKWSI